MSFTSATELAGLDAEQVLDLSAPLVSERLAIHQHERRGAARRDDGAGHHGLAGAGRGHQQPEVVWNQVVDRGLLDRV